MVSSLFSLSFVSPLLDLKFINNKSKRFVISSFGCREAGVVIQNLDISCGEVSVSLNEELLSKNKKLPDAFPHTDKVMGLAIESVATEKPNKEQAAAAAITKYASIFPEKVRRI